MVVLFVIFDVVSLANDDFLLAVLENDWLVNY